MAGADHRTVFCFGQPFHDADGKSGVVVAEFEGCSAVKFGFPNDETLHGHPLYQGGIQVYAVHTIADSPWIEEMHSIERHHPRAPEHPFETSSHYLLAFHDSTLKAIAEGIALVAVHDSVPEAVSHMASLLG